MRNDTPAIGRRPLDVCSKTTPDTVYDACGLLVGGVGTGNHGVADEGSFPQPVAAVSEAARPAETNRESRGMVPSTCGWYKKHYCKRLRNESMTPSVKLRAPN